MRSKLSFREWIPVIVVAVALLLVPMAMYVAGLIYFMMHKVSLVHVGLFSWLDYFLTDKTDSKKQLLSLFFAVQLTYAILPITIYLLVQKRRELHGAARFANTGEIRKAKLLGKKSRKENGLIVGKYNGQLLVFTGQQFALLAAPTRSGKGVGIVIPNCLFWEDSMVILDIKQENFNLTSGYRKNTLGQAVFLFNPFAFDAV